MAHRIDWTMPLIHAGNVSIDGIGQDTLYIPIQYTVHFKPFDKGLDIWGDFLWLAGMLAQLHERRMWTITKGVGAIKYDRRTYP